MRLQICPAWAVDWDSQCYTLIHLTVITGEGKGAKKVKAENIGKMRENLVGYYGSNLKQALMAYVTKAALEGDGVTDVSGLLYKLDQIEATVAKLGKPTFADDAPQAEATTTEAPVTEEPPKPAIAALDL